MNTIILSTYQPRSIYVNRTDSKWIHTSIFAELDGWKWYKTCLN